MSRILSSVLLCVVAVLVCSGKESSLDIKLPAADFRGETATSWLPKFEPFTGKMSVQWRLVFGASLEMEVNMSVVNNEYMGIGFAHSQMHGNIVACHVPSDNVTNAVCSDVAGQVGGGVIANSTKYSKVLASSMENGFSKVTFRINLDTIGIHMNAVQTENTRMIFAHGHWDSTTKLPTYHGLNNATFLWANLMTGESVPKAWTPVLNPFPGIMSVQWRIIVGIKLQMEVLMSVAGNMYMGMGFSNTNMAGPIVACHVPANNATDAMCVDVEGQNGGGVVQNSTSYSSLRSSGMFGGFSHVRYVVDLQTVGIDTFTVYLAKTRLIFAHGHWDSTTNLPTYHGPNNATIMHVNLMTGNYTN